MPQTLPESTAGPLSPRSRDSARVAYNPGPSRGARMSELIQTGLNVTVIGMGVVFVLLTLLVFIIHGMSALSRFIEGPGTPTSDAPAAGQPLSQNELVGVISAAIAAYRKRR